MEHEFWHEKWEKNQIGFHEGTVNAYLQSHWKQLRRNETETVLVPLCGKSHDLFWIRDQGHQVIGVELSPIACKDLFEEAGLKAEVTQHPPFTLFREQNLTIYMGDFFDITPDQIHSSRLVYDRAALIAFPETMRQKYVNHLNALLPPNAEMLLVSLEYPQSEMSGPPFAVLENEIQALYGDQWEIKKIHEQGLGRDHPFAKRKGLSSLIEKVFHLTRNTKI